MLRENRDAVGRSLFGKSLARMFCALILAAVFSFASVAEGKMYKWKDEKGEAHFTDDESKIPAQYRKKTDLEVIRPTAVPPKSSPPSHSSPIAPQNPETPGDQLPLSVESLNLPENYRTTAEIGPAMLWFKDESEPPRQLFILEYSDFQCPVCKNVQPVLLSIKSRYASQVQFGYRHFPLAKHKKADYLAEAAECAREQSLFWEMHSTFYRVPTSRITEDDLVQYAKQAGISSPDDFRACLSQGKYSQHVQTDIAVANQLGVNGTPSFVVGIFNPEQQTVTGKLIAGAPDEEWFVKTIDYLLAKIKYSQSVPSGAANPPVAK
jgi:protein-disulfide isomerase